MTNGVWASRVWMEVTRSDESEQSDEKRQRGREGKRSSSVDERGWVKWNTRRDGTLNFLTATRNIVFRPDLYFCTRTQKK